MMMNTGLQRQYMRQKDYRYCHQHHGGVTPQHLSLTPQLVFPMVVNPEAARASNMRGNAVPASALTLSPATVTPEAMAEPVRTSLPAIKQMLAARLYPSGFPVGPLYVNEKQYYRILRRRQMRLKFNNKRGSRGYMHESRHKHAMNRPRGPGGRFLSSSNNSKEAEGNNTIDASNESEDQHQEEQNDNDIDQFQNTNNPLNNIQIDHQQQRPSQIPPPLEPPQIRQMMQPSHQQESVFQPPIDLNTATYCVNPSSSTSIPTQPQDTSSAISMHQIPQSLMSSLSLPDHPIQLHGHKGV